LLTNPFILLSQQAFGDKAEVDGEKLADQIYTFSDEMRTPLRQFIRVNKLELLIVQNALTIPMNLPLGVCLTGLIAEWELIPSLITTTSFGNGSGTRPTPSSTCLDTTFPAKLPSIQHVTINSIAQNRLKARRGIDSIVIPNVHDFASPSALDR
jgi:mannosylglucosylglycerate synthase